MAQQNQQKEITTEREMTYEVILKHVGPMGRFQKFVFILLCFPFCMVALGVASIVFTHGIPEYRCYVPGCESEDTALFSPPWLNCTIPEDVSLGPGHPSRCLIFNDTWDNISECSQEPFMNETRQCNKWIFDTSTFGSTIVTEFELTCENEWIQPILSSCFMFGMLFGSLVFGPISDKFGRRVAFVTSVTWMGVFTSLTALSPDVIVFAVLRFLTGLGTIGCFQSGFVWGIEYVGSSYFVMCGFIFQSVGSVFSMIYTGIASWVRDWKILQLIAGLPLLFFISYWWIIPESPRWLLSKGKRRSAKQLAMRIARFNKRVIPEQTLDAFLDQSDPLNKSSTSSEREANSNGPSGVLAIFKSPVLRKRALVLFTAWCAADMGYYGLSLTTSYIPGDVYINFLLSLAVELPSYFAGIFIMDKLGRRGTLVTFLIVGGVSCLVAGTSPADIAALVITFSLIGKFSATLVLANVYSYTTELFPTVSRSAAVGMCSTCGRLGAILAPIVASTARLVYAPLPFLIFGVLNIVVGLLTLLLPETLGIDLPSTIEEAIELEKRAFSWKACYPKRNVNP